MARERRKVEIENCVCINTTALALLVSIGDGPAANTDVWIPKSQLHEESEVNDEGDKGTLVVTEWIAIMNDLI